MSHFLLILKKELLNFLRDRQTIIYSVVMPIVLYPLIFWGMNQIMSLQRGSLDKMPLTIAVQSPDPSELIYRLLESESPFKLYSGEFPSEMGAKEFSEAGIDIAVRYDATRQPFQLELFFSSASDRSKEGRDRVAQIAKSWRYDLIEDVSGLDENEFPALNLHDVDISARKDRAKFLLGIILPMLIVIITVMGGLHPAIEVIVGEREKNTFETTLSAPSTMRTVLTAKFTAVVIMSLTAVLLNVVSILLTIKHTLFMSADLQELDFSIPLSAFPLIFIGALMVAVMFSAVMILAASFARTYKEGQGFVAPLYALGIQPAVVSALPGVPFNEMTALIPISNISLMFRELIRSQFDPVPVAITLTTTAIWCVAFLWLANRLILRESFRFSTPKFSWKNLLTFTFEQKGH